jgi:hypothetical protein
VEPGRGRRVVGQRRLDPDPEPRPTPPETSAGPEPLAEEKATRAPLAPVPKPPIDWSVPSGDALRARQLAWLKERARFEARTEESAARGEGGD